MAPDQRKQTNIDVALATRPINETLDLRFADNVRRGLFPSTFQSYDELLSYLNLLHSEGKSKKEIEEAVGIKTGRDFTYAKSGGFSLNTRKMAELVPLGLIDHIKGQEAAGIFPPGTAKRYLDDVHRTWNESSKRTQQIAATTAGYWDNGHWVAAKDPNNLGPTTGRNANPEPQKSFIGADGVPIQGNAVHQEMPRANINQAGLDALGIPKNWFEDFYEFVMRDPKLNRSGTNMGSGLGRSMTDAEAMRINSGFASPEQLASQVDLETQLIEQGVSPEDVNPNITMAGPLKVLRGPSFPEYSKGQAPKGLMSKVGQDIGGYLPIPIPTGSQLRQNALGMGLGAATEAITPESAYAAGKGDWRTAAVEGVKAAATGAITGGAIQAGLTNLMPRAATALASGPAMPLVAGVGTALTLQDAAQAYRAGQAGRSIPLQKKVEQSQQDKRRQQDVAQFRAAMPGVASKNRMQADLSGRLSPQQIESFRAGGGNAAMMRDGLSVQQVIERGSSLRLKKIVNSTIRDQV